MILSKLLLRGNTVGNAITITLTTGETVSHLYTNEEDARLWIADYLETMVTVNILSKADVWTDMSYLFAGSTTLTTASLEYLDTACVTDMSYMFAGCTALQLVYCTSWDVASVITMEGMFNGCENLINYTNAAVAEKTVGTFAANEETL